MPISRYEVRNEYSLADPELYRAADKDDPEALLEGVSMAGLVGVLRQLGDLAEFAADIFHNLHEEVMATAARGHGLLSRVQQLESEIPSIERAFLAQTDHSSFFTRPGVDWHPNLRIDQNLVTQGDLPRFVMDSYEECRPPPRLFILDKFDVAGAGACLKRYTDPSFFKVENSEMTMADVPREKKIRKAKKKGPRWKNRETPEALPSSHTKLHQLFMEEARIENNISNPTRRATLKRKLNGFPFNSKTGKSYMEKLLQHPSPDNKEVTFDHTESGLEVVEIRPVNRDRENVGTKSCPPSPNRESNKVPNLYPTMSTDDGISSTPDEKVIAVDGESNRESYQSDDVVSEVDNYVDETSNAKSDTDADSRLRAKSDFTSLHIKNESLISDVNDENLQTGSFDSQSTGDSTISDDGNNNSSRKGIPTSFGSDSPSTSAENPRSERISYKGFSSDHIPEVDASSYHKTDDDVVDDDDDFLVDQHPKPVISDKTDFTLDDEENKSNLVMEPPCSPSFSDFDLQSGDESRRSSAGEHMVDEPNGESIPYVSAVPYIHYRTTHGMNKLTSDLLHGDESEQKDRNSVENIAFEISNVNYQKANGTPSELPYPENIPSDYPDIVHNGDIKSTVSREEILIKRLDNEHPDVSTDSPNQFPSFMDNFLKNKLEETSSADSQTIDPEDNQDRSTNDQICSQNLVSSHQANSSDWPQAGLDAHEGDVVPEKETTVNETFAPETPNVSEVQESPFSTPGEIKEPAGTLESVEMNGTKSNDLEVTEISGSGELKLPNEVDILLGNLDLGEENSNTAVVASDVPALFDNLIIDDVSSPVGLINVEEEDSDIDELGNDENSLSERHDESGFVEKVDQTVLCKIIDNDNPNSELLSGTVPNAQLDLEIDQDLKLIHPEIIQPPVEQNLSDRESESEESIVQEEIGSLPTQLDQELVHSSEIDSEVSPVLPIIHQQTPGHDDLKGDGNLKLDAPKDSLDSVPPPSYPVSETDQINLGDIAPLPPLPPAQWMMDKLQLGSSSTEGEMMKHDKLLFPQFISRPVVPTEETKNPPIQMTGEPASEKEKVFESSLVEVNAAPETVDLPLKSENKQQLIVVPTISESDVASPAEDDGAGNKSQTVKFPRPRHPLIDEFTALDKSKLRKVTERVTPHVPKVEERNSLLEQIRTKSFNLRPALASRPSVRGPNTNLKVAAIVEKANAIRQALADTDEEDDDSWSD
ncbi:hypothetical protein CASFOL_037752 [Castilleja foliolosa]|uniref:Protein SCAR n=1 Tax=Castilleja foliolosa TaxID=1961234 RepID=A0ABD3BJY5_9LAMI